jgi:hypothetical protein
LIAYAGVHLLIAWLAFRLASMLPAARQGVARLGQVGRVTKGVALGVLGGLLGYAALTL